MTWRHFGGKDLFAYSEDIIKNGQQVKKLIVHGILKSWIWLRNLHFHFHLDAFLPLEEVAIFMRSMKRESIQVTGNALADHYDKNSFNQGNDLN